jgi:hypothetical protein
LTELQAYFAVERFESAEIPLTDNAGNPKTLDALRQEEAAKDLEKRVQEGMPKGRR